MINQEALITFSYLLPASISVLYILAMGARFYDLRSNIRAEPLPYNYSIILRISLLTLDISNNSFILRAAEFIEILLVIFYSETKRDYLSGVLFVNISAIIMQIFLMCYEYKKRVPLFFAHKIYWILNWLFLLVSFALLINYVNSLHLTLKGHIYEYCLSLFRIVDYTVLLVFTLFLRRQDLSEFESVGFWRNEFPDIDLSDSERRARLSTLNGICYQLSQANSGSLFLQIDVKKRWNIVNDDVEVKLEIQIVGLDKQFKLKKSVSEIFEWHQSYIYENADYFEQHPNELLSLNFFVKQIQDSQDLQLINNIQRYLNAIISKLDLITQSFMDFIELSQQEKALVDEIKQINNIQSNQKSSLAIKQIQPIRKQKWDVQSEYLPYMQVHITEHQTIKSNNQSFLQYTLVVQFDNETFVVQKRFKEFFEFCEQMKSQLETKNFPPFPQKTLIKLTNEEIEERKQELEIFMKLLLNDRQYHISLLFRFIGMPQQIEDLVRNMQRQIITDSEQIVKLYIKNIGYEEFHGKDGEKFFRYSFQISFGDQKHIIWKRFSQFDELHYLLKQRYQQLPQLPFKTTAALQQISPNLRSLNLQQYLQDLIKVPAIGENVHLRQFLEMKNFQGNLDIENVIGSLPQLENILEKLDKNNKDIDQLDNMKSRLWQ
ncbi:unnamed protein product (macronuclear) [Paramecium tetraurelia]|uniref:PX domain-containing protein n=1 Tax=Paramecium tetraurelia TaxID=5888 RepID=A0CPP9_PARTE|nr:uncharacterized protein GSPATT00009158001 [Paramecium tetraurelia]CAK72766.1 unnamed protein product [Paramecium tetraurelia]|eukprot:XP_001440163.1 hypothetical protein (macronuclear) [Paramecium tetraurelia strain d4-2]